MVKQITAAFLISTVLALGACAQVEDETRVVEDSAKVEQPASVYKTERDAIQADIAKYCPLDEEAKAKASSIAADFDALGDKVDTKQQIETNQKLVDILTTCQDEGKTAE